MSENRNPRLYPRLTLLSLTTLASVTLAGCYEAEEKIRKELERLWEHGENSMTDLEDHERRARLGHVPGPGEPSHAEAEVLADANHADLVDSGDHVLTTTIDYRDINGKSYINPVRDQGQCGSCVTFATTAVMDAAIRIGKDLPVDMGPLPDVSEAQLAWCGGRENICETGWWISNAASYMENDGLTSDDAYPYSARQQTCESSLVDEMELSKITRTVTLNDHDSMMKHLREVGPLAADFTVYDDFWHYNGGIYHQTSNKYEGGHAVAVIGYGRDETSETNYWIVQNSWGTGWGEAGYFKIGFGEAGIDDTMVGFIWEDGTPAYVGDEGQIEFGYMTPDPGDEVYCDYGSGADHDVCCYAVIPPDGYSTSLGDYCQGDYDPPRGQVLVASYIEGYPMEGAIGWERITDDRGSGADQDGTWWRAICPDGFSPVGDIVGNSTSEPPDHARYYGCVADNLLEQVSTSWIWTDEGSGADSDIGLWEIGETGLFTSTDSHTQPGSALAPRYAP